MADLSSVRTALENMYGKSSSFTEMNDEELSLFTSIIREEIDRRENAGKVEQVRDIVPIEQWINSPYYIGEDYKSIYPYWRDLICDIFSSKRTKENNITQLIFGGCFTGDTKVSLLSGEEISFEDLSKLYPGEDQYFWVYSCDKCGNIVPGRAHNVRVTKITRKIARVHLDNGDVIECTPDHKFLLRDGKYKSAENLSEGVSLMPLYRDYKVRGKYDHGTPEGYERVYNPKDGLWKVTHKVVVESLKNDEVLEVKNRFKNDCVVVTHHIDMNKRNNNPENLKPMESTEHLSYHKVHSRMMFDDPVIGPRVRSILSRKSKERWDDPEYKSKISQAISDGIKASEKSKVHTEYMIENVLNPWAKSEEGRAQSVKNLEKWNNRDGYFEEDINRWKNSISDSSKRWWNSEDGIKEREIRREKYKERNSSGETGRLLREFWKTDRGRELKEEKRDQRIKRNVDRAEYILKARRDYFISKGVGVEELYDALMISKSWSSAGRLLSDKFDLKEFSLESSSHMNTFLRCFGLCDDGDYKNARRCITDELDVNYTYKNHRVMYVEIVDKRVPVYDLEVDDYHNFALSSGVFVHNSIGVGKSTAAELCTMRKLYELSCYKNVNAMFNLMSKTNIMFFYFSINKTQAESTGFGELRSFIDHSPYFREHFKRRERLDSLLVFPEGITVAYGSRSSDSIGMSVICQILDEANFAGGNGSNSSGNTEKALDMYAGMINRANSRFIMDGGQNHSLSILVSSATHESSATERQIAMSKDDPHTIVAAPSQWEVKPDKFSNEYFYVLKGTNYLEPQIINSTDDVNNFRLSEGLKKERFIDGVEDFDSIEKEIKKLPPHMQERFLKVPVDLKRGFEMNIIRSLQDLGGVSTGTTGKLFNSPAVFDDCIDPRFRHPFTAQEIIISTGDRIEIKDYLKDDFVLRHPERKRYIHIDQSTTNDSTGISSVYIEDVEEDEETGMKKPIIGVDFVLRINPPKPPKKIAIYKIRNFVVYLGRSFGMNIGKVTYDIFNSEESRQILEEMGFNVAYQSVDRTDKAYLDLVEIMYEGRLKMYDYPILRHELFNLIHYRDKRKVDHPKLVRDSSYTGKGSTEGSKDTSDALCGAVQNLLLDTISSGEGQNTLDDFFEANKYRTAFEPDSMNADEMIDKILEDTIDDLEAFGYSEGGIALSDFGTGFF